MRDIASDLPAGWAECRVSDVAEVNPALDRCPFPQGGNVHFVPMPAVEAESGRIDVSQTRPHDEVRKGYTAFVAGDVLFAKITPCMENGKMAVVPALPASVAFGSTERSAELPRRLPQYLYHFVSGQAFRHEAEHNMTGAVGQKRVPRTFVADQTFPLPPTCEQHRIVAKIEELFSELDKAVESLTLARAQLKTYRQALLKAAFEGKLTADWRAANPDQLEPPETLLARIHAEREARYKEALGDWRAGGEVGRKPARPRCLSEIASHQAGTGPWPIVELGDVLAVSSGEGLTSSDMRAGPHPVYGGNGIAGYHNDWLLSDPALVIGRVGAKCVVTHITLPKAWVTDNALIVRPLIETFDMKFFRYILEHMNLNTLGSSTGQPVISGSKIYGETVALPSKVEQSIVADLIEASDTVVQSTTGEIDGALARIAALRQSILKQAFSGQLVPKDPTDEPATALLARLRAR